MIYLDNAATTMHKPQEMIEAVVHAMGSLGNAGRGANTASLGAARLSMRQENGWHVFSERMSRSRSPLP